MRSVALSALVVLAACSESKPPSSPPVDAQAGLEQPAETAAAPLPSVSAKPTPTAAQAKPSAKESKSTPFMTAFGTEPFWSFDILDETVPNDSTLRRLRYSSPELAEPILVTAKFAHQGKRLSYSGKIDGKPFTLVVDLVSDKDNCSDGMSDDLHQFSVIFTRNGHPWPGCANFE